MIRNRFVFKNIITLFFLLSLSLGFSNSNDENDLLEQYLKESEDCYYRFDNLKSLELSKKAYELAKKSNQKEKLALSCYRIATALSVLGLNDSTLEFIKEGQNYCPKENEQLLISFNTLEAYVFTRIGLFKEANKIYYTIYQKNKFKTDPQAKLELLRIYQDISYNYVELNENDSVLKYYELARKSLRNIKLKDDFETLPVFYANYGSYFLERNQRDSAFAMFSKCREIETKYNKPYLYQSYLCFGQYYYGVDAQKSLDFFLKGIEIIEKHQLNSSNFVIIYKLISEQYEELGNKEMQTQYLKIYQEKLEKEDKTNNETIEKAISIILDKQNDKHLDRLYELVAISALIILVLVFVIYKYIKKAKQKREQFNRDLLEKEEAVKVLKHQINESFSELIDLAKNNSHQFWFRFQEVYPEFMTKMLALNPTLKVSELTYCAYIYLGFSNKEIADYTFKASKTIENNRYNLRKKLKLKSEDNFIIWLIEYLDKN